LEDIYFSVFEEIFKIYQGRHGKMNIFLGPVSPVWVSDALLLRIKEKAKAYGTGIHMHCLETYYQRVYGLRKFGKSLIEHLNELGILGPEVSLAHCVWPTEKEIDLLSEAETSVVHNPGSNLRLRSGVAPVLRLWQKGVNTGIGIDGITLNDTDDLLEEMRLCSKLHWMPGIERESLSSLDVLRMATISGAKIAQFKQIGVLRKGFKADLVLMDLKKFSFPYLEARKNIWDIVLARGNSTAVDTVLIGGEVLKRNKKLQKLDKRKIIGKLQNSLKGEKAKESVALENLIGRIEPYIKKFYRDWEIENVEAFYSWNSRT
jgi:5-methylthioadenosine/S-adenosylhomocysteine deaminase